LNFGENGQPAKNRVSDARKGATSATKKTNLLSNLSVKTVFDERIENDAREGLTENMMLYFFDGCKQRYLI
jgi:hypothetical protein